MKTRKINIHLIKLRGMKHWKMRVTIGRAELDLTYGEAMALVVVIAHALPLFMKKIKGDK